MALRPGSHKKECIMEGVSGLQNARQGDLEAFNCLVREHQDLVYNLAYRLLGDPRDASDAAQEAFILAYRNPSSYHEGSIRVWISRITTKLCYDKLRLRRRHSSTRLVPCDQSTEGIDSPYWIIDQSDSPEEVLLCDGLRDVVQRCLGRLPLKYRTIVVLVDVLDLEYPEAAEVIGRPVSTVKSRLARARVQLRDMLLTLRVGDREICKHLGDLA